MPDIIGLEINTTSITVVPPPEEPPLVINATTSPIEFSTTPTGPTILDILVGGNFGTQTLSLVDNETPVGLINGANAFFESEFPYFPESLKVYVNGIRISEGVTEDYIITGNTTFTLNESPVIGDIILIDYSRSA